MYEHLLRRTRIVIVRLRLVVVQVVSPDFGQLGRQRSNQQLIFARNHKAMSGRQNPVRCDQGPCADANFSGRIAGEVSRWGVERLTQWIWLEGQEEDSEWKDIGGFDFGASVHFNVRRVSERIGQSSWSFAGETFYRFDWRVKP